MTKPTQNMAQQIEQAKNNSKKIKEAKDDNEITSSLSPLDSDFDFDDSGYVIVYTEEQRIKNEEARKNLLKQNMQQLLNLSAAQAQLNSPTLLEKQAIEASEISREQPKKDALRAAMKNQREQIPRQIQPSTNGNDVKERIEPIEFSRAMMKSLRPEGELIAALKQKRAQIDKNRP